MEMNPISVRNHLSDIVQILNFNYDQCLSWIENFDSKFGYVSMAQYIRVVEMLNLEREQKDKLLRLAFDKMDYGNYEMFFEMSFNIAELYQKIFLLIMIEYVADYLKRKSFIVWEVIARYYMEEHLRLDPNDFQLDDYGSDFSSKRKIYLFFTKKNIDLQEKLNFHTQTPSFFEMIMQYFNQTLQ
jgi:hypothetical protein